MLALATCATCKTWEGNTEALGYLKLVLDDMSQQCRGTEIWTIQSMPVLGGQNVFMTHVIHTILYYIYINLLNTTIPLICNLVIIDSNYTINEYPITTYLLTYISIFSRDQCPMSFSSRARWPTKWLLGSSAKRPWVFRPSVFRPGQNMELSEVMWGKSSNKLVIICYNQWENFNGLGQPSFLKPLFLRVLAFFPTTFWCLRDDYRTLKKAIFGWWMLGKKLATTVLGFWVSSVFVV